MESIHSHSGDPVIAVENVRKTYRLWPRPSARLAAAMSEQLGRVALLPGPMRRGFQRFSESGSQAFHAVEDVSFNVYRGETVGIIGRNGAGKSTLLQMIAGTLRPTAGNVTVNGRVAALLELGSGFNPEFTGKENVYLNGTIHGLSRQEVDARFDSIARFADIGKFIYQPVRTYSSGMTVRLGFAVQTALDPEVLIVDEALAVGDETFQRKCMLRLERLRDAGTTILFVSHSMGPVLNLCTRALFLHKGQLIMEGEPKIVASNYQRYANAAPEKQESIMERIRSKGRDATAHAEAAETAKEPEDKEEGPDENEHFDPSLKSQSKVDYEPQGAQIHDIGLFDTEGQPVNILKKDAFYEYRYKVRFDKDIEDVSFAMLIKTPRGQDLGGCSTHQNRIPKAEAGCVYEVRFRFQCLLNPWTYFFNAGVEGVVDDQRAYPHRVIDALAFRVEADDDLASTGIVDFHVEGRFAEVSQTSQA